MITTNGIKKWTNDDVMHCKYMPAVSSCDVAIWAVGGYFHREDGPAITNKNGTVEWYFQGRKYNQLEYIVAVNSSSKVFYEIDD